MTTEHRPHGMRPIGAAWPSQLEAGDVLRHMGFTVYEAEWDIRLVRPGCRDGDWVGALINQDGREVPVHSEDVEAGSYRLVVSYPLMRAALQKEEE